MIHPTGDQIRKVRKVMGLSVRAFSRMLGVHEVTTYRWENAERAQIEGLHGEILWVLIRCKSSALKRIGLLICDEPEGLAMLSALLPNLIYANMRKRSLNRKRLRFIRPPR